MKRVARRRMDEQREKMDVRMSLTERLVKNHLRWAGHLVWMEEGRIAKKADGLREQEVDFS